jgi:hypothetical protein
MTTASEEKAGQEAVSSEVIPEPLRRQARTRASSIAPGLPPSPQVVTQRVLAVRACVARVAAFLDRPGSLVHAQPPTFARAREQHHEAARRHDVFPVLGHLRLVWGYWHLLLVKPVLNGLEWATESPLKATGLIILFLIIWHWS